MNRHRFIKSKKAASETWKRKEFYNLSNFSVSDLCRIYLELNPGCQLVSRRVHFRSFVNSFRDTSIKDVSTSGLNEWFIKVKNSSQLSERTLSQIKCQLAPFFKWLVLENIIPTNPLLQIRFRRNVPPVRKRCVLNKSEIQNLLVDVEKHDPHTLYPYLYAVIQTGARRSEVAKLRWGDIDFDSAFIIFRSTKNGSDRKIKIANSLVELLKKKARNSEFVFPSRNGTYFSRSSIERAVLKFKTASTFAKNWHIHDLRHSYAYNFLKNGGEMYQLQALLGHKSIQMTVDLYGNLKSHDISNPSPYDF